MMSAEIQLLQSAEELLQLRTAWNKLSDNSVYPNIFTTWDWQSLWQKWFAPELKGGLFILTVKEDNELIGIVPFYRRKNPLPIAFGKKQLCFIGYGGLTCPEYLGPVIKQGKTESVCKAAVKFLKEHMKEWDSMFFEDYALDDPGTTALAEYLKKEFAAYSGKGENRYILPLPENYEAYLQSLGKHNRSKKRLKMNQAVKKHNAFVRFQAAEQIEEWFPVITSLTTDSRSRKNQENPMLNPVYAAFHKELLLRLLPQKRVLIQILYLDEQPAASRYVYLFKDKAYGYQTAFKQDADGSPGTVCTCFLLEHLMQEGFKEIDFLRGNESYKTSFTDKFRQTEQLYVFRKSSIDYYERLLIEKIIRPAYRFVKRLLKRE